MTVTSFSQSDVTISNPSAEYLRTSPLSLNGNSALQPLPITSDRTLDFPIGQPSSGAAISVNTNSGKVNHGDGGSGAGAQGASRTLEGTSPGGNIFGLTTVPTFQGAFFTGSQFNFTMIGNHPLAGHRTTLPAQITSVSLRLLNANGTVNLEIGRAHV